MCIIHTIGNQSALVQSYTDIEYQNPKWNIVYLCRGRGRRFPEVGYFLQLQWIMSITFAVLIDTLISFLYEFSVMNVILCTWIYYFYQSHKKTSQCPSYALILIIDTALCPLLLLLIIIEEDHCYIRKEAISILSKQYFRRRWGRAWFLEWPSLMMQWNTGFRLKI